MNNISMFRNESKRVLTTMLLASSMTLAAMAQGSKAISVNFNNEKATTALHQVEKKSGKKIQYNYGDVNFRVTVSAKNKTAVQVVNDIIRGHQLRAVAKGEYIVTRWRN